MWRTALLRSRGRLLFGSSQLLHRSFSTNPTATVYTKNMRGAPWERVLEGGKEYGTVMASVLTFFIIFGVTVQTVRCLASSCLVCG